MANTVTISTFSGAVPLMNDGVDVSAFSADVALLPNIVQVATFGAAVPLMNAGVDVAAFSAFVPIFPDTGRRRNMMFVP